MKNNTFTHYRLYPWIVWALASAFFFYKFTLEVSPSVMSHELMDAFSIQGAQLGNLAASYFYAYLIMQLPVGLLIDRFGPRRLTTLAIFLCATGGLTLSHANHLGIACIGRFITGTGAAFAVISALKCMAVWFPTNRFAFMTGLVVAVGMLGAVGGQAPLALLIHHVGWKKAIDIISLLGFLLMALYFVMIRDQNPKQRPEENHHTISMKVALTHVVKNKQNWLLSLYSGLAFAPVAVIGGLWGVPFLSEAYHLSTTLAAADISLIFIGLSIGTPIFGFLSDRAAIRKPFILAGTFCALIALSFIIYMPALPHFILSATTFIFGFSMGAFVLSFSMIRERNPLIYAASAIAAMNALNALLCAISDPLIGAFLDLTWKGQMQEGAPYFSVADYRIALTALPIYFITALLLILFTKETNGGAYAD